MVPDVGPSNQLRFVRFGLTAMGHEIMDSRILRRPKGRSFVLNPFFCAHIAHTVKVRAFFDHDDGTLYVTDEDARLLNFHLLLGADRALDPPADGDGAGSDHALDDGALSDNDRAARMHFPFDTPVDANRS